MLARWLAQLTVSTFKDLSQYGNSPGNKAYCYAELAVSFPAVAKTIASTLCAYPQRDGQAEWCLGE